MRKAHGRCRNALNMERSIWCGLAFIIAFATMSQAEGQSVPLKPSLLEGPQLRTQTPMDTRADIEEPLILAPSILAPPPILATPSIDSAALPNAALGTESPSGAPLLLAQPTPMILPPDTSYRLPVEEENTRRLLKPRGDPYAPQGLKLGGLTLYPSLGVGATWSSNARQSSEQSKKAVGLNLQPTLRFASDWVRHAFAGEATGDFIDHFRKDIPKPVQIATLTQGRIDLRRNVRAETETGYEFYKQSPDNPDVVGTSKNDLKTHKFRGSLALIYEGHNMAVRLKEQVRRYSYGSTHLEGGGSISNKDKNVTVPATSLRLTYLDPPIIRPFIEGEFASRHHDKRRDAAGLKLNGYDVTAKLGAEVKDEPFWQGEIALVYTHREFKEKSFKSENNLGIDANLRWSPSDLATLELFLSSGLMATSDVSSMSGKRHRARLVATRALRENLRATAFGEVKLDKPQGQKTDYTYDAGLGLEGIMTPNLAWVLDYNGRWYHSAQRPSRYNEQRITAGVVLRK